MLPSNRNYAGMRSTDESQAIAAFMSRVYSWMLVGISITAITSFVVSGTPAIISEIVQNKLLFFGLIILQFVAVISLTVWVQRMSVTMASFVFALYSTLTGMTLSVLFLVYTMASITSAFVVTSVAFGGLSAFGYITKRDLGPIGTFCMMGLFGLIAVMVLGLFIPSMMGNTMQLTISVLGLLIFAGLTAYDTQRIKYLQSQFVSADQARKGAIYGALILYLDFINLFLNILRLMGDRR